MSCRKCIIVIAIVALFCSTALLTLGLPSKAPQQNAVVPSGSYDLGDYQVKVNNSSSVVISQIGIVGDSRTITMTVFAYSGNQSIRENATQSSVNTINNSLQDTVALINAYKSVDITYVFTYLDGHIVVSIVETSSKTPTYIDYNVSLSSPQSIEVWTRLSGPISFNSSYGRYVFSDNVASFEDNYEVGYYSSSTTLNWVSMQSQGHFDFGVISVAPSGDYLELMTGPFMSNGGVETNFDAFTFGID